MGFCYNGVIKDSCLEGAKNMGYRIGSFNIESKRHTAVEHGRDLFGLIHDVICDENLDIFVLQEVLNDSEYNAIKRNLPLSWTGDYRNPGKGKHSQYGFAFFWNTNRFKECSRDRMPQILDYYKSRIHLNREPFFGRFAPVGVGAFREYRLVDIHLTSSDQQQKKNECKTVFGAIYHEADTHSFGNFRPAITTVLGDFNYTADECGNIAREVQASEGYPYIATALRELTHIQNSGYNSSLDHFSYNDSKYSDHIIAVSRIDVVFRYFQGDFKTYTEKISDHVPIVIELV